MPDIIEELEQYAKLAMPDYPNDLCSRAKQEIERLQDAKRRALAIADERVKENVALRSEKIWFDLKALADRIVGIQEDLPNEDDRAALGEAAHWLCKFAERYNQQERKI